MPRPAVPARAATAALVVLAALAPARAAEPEPLVQVSGPSPFAACTEDFPSFQPGILHPDSEVEPWLAVNPTNPFNVVAFWQQDRWSNGGARGLGLGVSFDGGRTWTRGALPGITRCAGGPWLRASDPWLSFGPDGTLHAIGLAFDVGFGARNAMVVSRSADGGLTWSAPVTLATGSPLELHDKESITADPADARYVYAVWDKVDFVARTAAAIFTRSADGGETWEPARVIHDPGPLNSTLGHQIVVLPDGTLLDFFVETIDGRISRSYLAWKRSYDRGVTWEPAGGAHRAFEIWPQRAFEPDGRSLVRDGAALFDVAVDPRSGAVYAVWQDGNLTGIGHSGIGFAASPDGGLTWTPRVVVNRTPSTLGFFERQAFTPSVHAAANGMIAVTHYDFRHNDTAPGALTDHWMIACHPLAADCAVPSGWREEIRLTDESFDIRRAPVANGLFLGDYLGLADAAGDPIALFTAPHGSDRASLFVRRVAFPARLEPEGLGWWKRQAAVASGRKRGRAAVSGEDLAGHLADIRAVHDLLDGAADAVALDAVLSPAEPAGARERARQHVAALMLNVASGRLSAWAPTAPGETAGSAAARLGKIVGDPSSPREALEAAKREAEALNGGAAAGD